MSETIKKTWLKNDEDQKLAPITLASSVYYKNGDAIEDVMITQSFEGAAISSPNLVNADTLGGHVTAENVVKCDLDNAELGQTHLANADLLGGRISAEDVDTINDQLVNNVVAGTPIYFSVSWSASAWNYPDDIQTPTKNGYTLIGYLTYGSTYRIVGISYMIGSNGKTSWAFYSVNTSATSGAITAVPLFVKNAS